MILMRYLLIHKCTTNHLCSECLCMYGGFVLTDSDEPPSSPRRRRAPSIPRNAEELASHLIHGSLRMTASRQQILSHSGIRLEERANALQEEKREKEKQNQTNDVFIESKNLLASSGEDEDSGESSSDYEPDSDSRLSHPLSNHTESTSSKQNREKSISIERKKSDSSTTKKRLKIERQKRKRGPRQNGSRSKLSENAWDSNESLPDDLSTSHYSKRRRRLNSSGAYATSTSEIEQESAMNGYVSPQASSVDVRPSKLNPARRTASIPSVGSLKASRGRSNSSQYETCGEDYNSEHLSDAHPLPSASSIDDLTTTTTIIRKRKYFKKGGQSQRGGIQNNTKRRIDSESSDPGYGMGGEVMSQTVNGVMTNGGESEIKPLDLVWAKCKGYPSYPALVSDI